MFSEKPTGADNQQRSLEHRLSWLGGVIDGEGMVTAIKRSSLTRNQYGFAPRISVVNTDLRMIDEVKAIFDEVGISYHGQEKAGKGTWKTKHEVLVEGFKRCSEALPILIPYLVAKKEKARRLLDLCESRLKSPRNAEYTAEQVELAMSLRERVLDRSETTRRAPGDNGSTRREAIVPGNAGTRMKI
jgi:hypothetical protein